MADDKKWYVVRVISGQERKIREHVLLEVNRSKWDKIVLNILVPTEKIYTIKAGKKTIKEKTLFPGYVYMEVEDKKMSQCFDVVSCWAEVGILGVVDGAVVVAGVPAGSRLACWIAVVVVDAVEEGGRSCCRCS